MKKKYIVFIVAVCIMFVTSCGHDFPPYVDTQTNVYKQLAANSGNEIDSIVKRVETIEALQNLKKVPKIVNTSDELTMLTEMMEVSIDGFINMDSIGMTTKNTLLLSNKNNATFVGAFNGSDSLNAKDGYRAKLIHRGMYTRNSEATDIWDAAHENYALKKEDSITENQKKRIEASYAENVALLKNIEYVVLEEDVLLIPPVLDLENEGFISGYIVTHLHAYDLKNLEKVAQMMVLSSNSDEVNYMSFENSSFSSKSYEEIAIKNQLRLNIISQKKASIDSVFKFNNSMLLR